MDFGMFSPQFCTLQIRFATPKNNREYALAHPRFTILLYVHLKCLTTHHSTHRLPAETGVALRKSFWVDDERIRGSRHVLIKRTLSIEQTRIGKPEIVIVAITRGREENAVAIIACHLITIDTVLSSRGPSAIVS